MPISASAVATAATDTSPEVKAVVADQVGVSVGPDGEIVGNASTLPVDVRRIRHGDTVTIQVVPRLAGDRN
jgi:hypothetical protein